MLISVDAFTLCLFSDECEDITALISCLEKLGKFKKEDKMKHEPRETRLSGAVVSAAAELWPINPPTEKFVCFL